MKRLRLLLGVATLFAVAPLSAQSRWLEPMYPPGAFNWQFLARYPEAARLINAFDYGHAILYQKLWHNPGDPASRLERETFAYLTGELLRHPPRFGIPEEAVAPDYWRLTRRAALTFDWAHVLHRQIYDVYADERMTPAAKDSAVERLTDLYLAEHRLALTDKPKTMELMDGQPFSQVFRRGYPRFNGLIWAYHWLQIALYEPMLSARSAAERKTGIDAVVAHFWRMVEHPDSGFPGQMPMVPVIAPHFTAAHPRAAAIFDNLHMLHDIVSDILVSPVVAREAKGRTIEAALDRFQNGDRDTMTPMDWQMMGEMMGGAESMGGSP
jgi:hypothetical protein